MAGICIRRYDQDCGIEVVPNCSSIGHWSRRIHFAYDLFRGRAMTWSQWWRESMRMKATTPVLRKNGSSEL